MLDKEIVMQLQNIGEALDKIAQANLAQAIIRCRAVRAEHCMDEDYWRELSKYLQNLRELVSVPEKGQAANVPVKTQFQKQQECQHEPLQALSKFYRAYVNKSNEEEAEKLLVTLCESINPLQKSGTWDRLILCPLCNGRIKLDDFQEGIITKEDLENV